MRQSINRKKLLCLLILAFLAAAGYMTIGVKFANSKLASYAMRIRTPKLLAMLVTAYAIGAASIVFQSIINNTIVTPCLLGMNALYTLIHTAVFFVAGSASYLATHANAFFMVDLLVMGVVATVIYGYLFRKTNHNVLYVLLIGTVLTSFFSSVQTTMTRMMDPNEYDALLNRLVASFFQRQFRNPHHWHRSADCRCRCAQKRACAAGCSYAGQGTGRQSRRGL